jgi:hypothetical protein
MSFGLREKLRLARVKKRYRAARAGDRDACMTIGSCR